MDERINELKKLFYSHSHTSYVCNTKDNVVYQTQQVTDDELERFIKDALFYIDVDNALKRIINKAE